MLSEKDVDEYQKIGYIKVDVLPSETKSQLSSWLSEISTESSDSKGYMRYHELHRETGEKILCRIENFADFHEGMGKLIKETLPDMVAQLWGERALPYKEKINFKLPGGNGFLPHQDAPAFGAYSEEDDVVGEEKKNDKQPPYVLRCSVMVAVDDSFPLNGGLDFVAGIHNEMHAYVHDSVTGGLDPQWVEEWERQKLWKPVECKAGEIVFFDAYVPHRSGPNATDKPRRAIYITYCPASEGDIRSAYYLKKREMFPPDNERIPGKDYSQGRKIFNLGNPII